MATNNMDGHITRRGFLESAALASVGLIGNANAGKSPPGAESAVDSANSDAVPPVGKIALEEHFILPENFDTSYTVRDLPPETRHKILDLGNGRIADMDRGGLDICILSLTAPESRRSPISRKPSPKRGERMTIWPRILQRSRNA
jgi:hypothetical protein